MVTSLLIFSYSVIQEGIGSALLHLVYTNNLPDIINNHKVHFKKQEVYCQEDGCMVNFFDDGTVYFSSKHPEES